MKTLVSVLLLLVAVHAQANLSAFNSGSVKTPLLQTFYQANGSCFKGVSKGSGFFSYIQLDNGYIGLYNKQNRNYEYAMIKKQSLVPSGIAISSSNPPKQITKISEQTLKQLRQNAFKKSL